ncbi:MAG: glycosyltransferase family 4 protein [Caldilineales bacterium]
MTSPTAGNSAAQPLADRPGAGPCVAGHGGFEYLRQIAAPHVPGDRLHILPLGVDTRLFTPTNSPNEPDPYALRITQSVLRPTPHAPHPNLLHVASLSPVKDQATLLHALAILVNSHPEVHLHIVGAGPLLASLTALAGDLGIASYVTFHGLVPHDQLPDRYRAADLFVLSSRYESQSLVALEAAACGCPVAGTAVGVLPELLPASQLAPAGDAGALAEAIRRLIENPEQRAVTARAVETDVHTRFSLDQTSNQLQLLYQGLATAAH